MKLEKRNEKKQMEMVILTNRIKSIKDEIYEFFGKLCNYEKKLTKLEIEKQKKKIENSIFKLKKSSRINLAEEYYDNEKISWEKIFLVGIKNNNYYNLEQIQKKLGLEKNKNINILFEEIKYCQECGDLKSDCEFPI